MNQREVKQKLYELVAEYFALLKARGSIVWGKTKPVNPNSPMIALTTSDVVRPSRPNRRYIDGIPHDSYPSKTMLRVNLYTKGAQTSTEEGVMARNENTAVSDLTDFVDFINSVHVDHWCGRNGISLRPFPVQDLTELTNDTSWEYRALLELEVGFTQSASGYTNMSYEGGIPLHGNGAPKYDSEGFALDPDGNRLPDPPLPLDPDGRPIYPPATPNNSGGGTQELADDFTGYFTEVEIEYKKEAPRHG